MAATHSQHPLLQEPTIYVEAPDRIKWKHFKSTFKHVVYGPVTELAKKQVPGKPGHFIWTVGFTSIFQAELVLATLQGQPFAYLLPSVIMVLSHCPDMNNVAYSNRLLPQYVKSVSTDFCSGASVTAQTAFRWFRNAGPLASVRVNVDVGSHHNTIAVEYYKEEHANNARQKGNNLHKKLRTRPKFTLRTYDPCALHCSGFGPTFLHANLTSTFSPFGGICSSTLYNSGDSNAHGIVIFKSPDCAAQALKAINGKILGSDTLVVRYDEPAAQHIFRRPPMPDSPPASEPENASTADSHSQSTSSADAPQQTPEDAARAQEEQLRREAIARELREAAARRAQEAATREAAEAKVKKAKERQHRQEEAERAHSKASERLKEARDEGHSALQELATAKTAREQADVEWEKAQEACTEAKRIWLESMDRMEVAKARASSAQAAVDDAVQRKLRVDRDINAAELEEESSRAAKEALDAEVSDEELDEETLRQAELAESIRRIRELREMEEAEKEEKARKARQAEEERLRREREEAERVAREQREREERARREAEAKKREEETKRKLYNQAVAKEQERCRLRDARLCPVFLAWHDQLAFERFKLVSDEFDSLKFHESQPLTFKSVPWPLLVRPTLMTFDSIDWSAVEKFFDAVENLSEDKAQFKAFVEKAHRRFHPDKWRARGILNSVQDQELRDRLEAAGNVVAQAITPLWLKSRQ